MQQEQEEDHINDNINLLINTTDRPRPRPTTAIVIVARHGERLDYHLRNQGKNWVEQTKNQPVQFECTRAHPHEEENERGGVGVGGDVSDVATFITTTTTTLSPLHNHPWDPPLTAHGAEQARRLGSQMQREVTERNLFPITAIYTSPLLRCCQTALCVKNAINIHNNHNRKNRSVLTSEEVDSSMHYQENHHRHFAEDVRGGCGVRMEQGLMESLNRNWYQSWALPGADGTWGYTLDSDSMHRVPPEQLYHEAARTPIQSLLDTCRRRFETKAAASASTASTEDYDLHYVSTCPITEPYRLYPPHLESRRDQQVRMRNTVEQLAVPGQTIVVVSHGGPVTHLYESVASQNDNWPPHGLSTYCCYSIYQLSYRSSSSSSSSSSKTSPPDIEWHALTVNQSEYLKELLVPEQLVL